MNQENKQTLNLPLSVVTTIDLTRLLREVKGIDDFINQSSIRKPGASMTLPRLSQTLDDFSKQNTLNLLDEKSRRLSMEYLENMKQNAPVLHISFSADATAQFLSKLIDWFRKEIHPQVLLQVGLQPSIAAGCVLRTPNKYFDLSLRNRMSKSKDILTKKLREALK